MSELEIILYVPILIFGFIVFRAMDVNSQIASDTLYGIFLGVIRSLTVLFRVVPNYSGDQKAMNAATKHGDVSRKSEQTSANNLESL